jgi:hypothetical protein
VKKEVGISCRGERSAWQESPAVTINITEVTIFISARTINVIGAFPKSKKTIVHISKSNRKSKIKIVKTENKINETERIYFKIPTQVIFP